MTMLDNESGALLWFCDHKDLQNARLQGDRVLRQMWSVFPHCIFSCSSTSQQIYHERHGTDSICCCFSVLQLHFSFSLVLLYAPWQLSRLVSVDELCSFFCGFSNILSDEKSWNETGHWP